jgi:predicted nuclease with TOPRIM domain
LAEVDYFSVLLSPLLSGVIVFTVLAINRFSRVGSSTLTGSVRIEGLEEKIAEVKRTVKEGITEIENSLQKKDEQFRGEFQRVWERIEKISSVQALHEYRLNETQSKRQPGDKSAV